MTKKKSKKDIKAERKMLVSVIEKAVRSEKENSLDDFPALVVANERRIKQLNLTPGVKLSQEGEWRWRGIKEHLGLQKKGNYFIWYNVLFNTNTLKLYIGNQEEHFAECETVDGSLELNKLLELFLKNKKNKNTI